MTSVSIKHALLSAMLARLQEPTPVIANEDRIRRSHKTEVTSDNAPAVYLDDGSEQPDAGGMECACDHTAGPSVRIFVSAEDGADALDQADAIMVEVLARLDPSNAAYTAYPRGVLLVRAAQRFEDDVQDGDAVFIEQQFKAKYSAPMWAPTTTV